MRRREFITLLGAAATWPLAAHAQQAAIPVVGFLSGRSLASDSDLVAMFTRALNEAGYVNGQNVAIEFRWADGQLNRLPELAAELTRGRAGVAFSLPINHQTITPSHRYPAKLRHVDGVRVL